MIEDVAKALCEASARSMFVDPDLITPRCAMCDELPDGTLVCTFWESFRGEARAAIIAARTWHKKERRWPNV